MKTSKSYFILLIVLINLFLIYAFYGLGSKETPQTYQTYNKSNTSTSFEFQKPIEIDEICYYFLINRYVDFKIETINSGRTSLLYEHYSEENGTVIPPYSFQWNCHTISPTLVQKSKMTMTNGQMMLAEMRFRQKGNDINFMTNHQNLNDETDIQVSQSYYDGMAFDEIFHARTAYEITKDIFPVYENTHPYLGKILMIPGIELFGMTPFGWRFSNVLFATFFIFVAYYFALKLFNSPRYAFVAAFLLTHSFMHLAESRLGLVNTYGVLFTFISYLFVYLFITRQKLYFLLLSGVFFGLAAAIKWVAVFSGLGFLLIAIYLLTTKYPLEKRFRSYRLILYGLLSHVLLALIIYILTFYDLYLKAGTFQAVLEYQVDMFNYHANNIPLHTYSSPWWSWALDIRPMSFHRHLEAGNISSISSFGNPAIFWLGIVAICYLSYIFIKRRTLEGTLILFAYLSLYLPHMFIERPMFIYHYYYPLPFLILAIIYGIKDFLDYYPKYTILLWIYLAIVAGLFLLFYPVLSGYPVSQAYIDNVVTWFPEWWWL